MYPFTSLLSSMHHAVARIEARNMIVMETVGLVDIEFMITRGDRSVITRAFVSTRSLSATEGKMSSYVLL